MVPVQKAIFSPVLLQPGRALHRIVAARMLPSSQSTHFVGKNYKVKDAQHVHLLATFGSSVATVLERSIFLVAALSDGVDQHRLDSNKSTSHALLGVWNLCYPATRLSVRAQHIAMASLRLSLVRLSSSAGRCR